MLGLLIVIAAGMLIYYFSVYRPNASKTSSADSTGFEDWRIKGSAKANPKAQPKLQPSSRQPHITEYMAMKAYIMQDQQPRAYFEWGIDPEGNVGGVWRGKYVVNDEYEYEILTGGVEGNIDASKVYKDASGEDPTRLYFITKGALLMLETHIKSYRLKQVNGNVYITGWIKPDFSVVGEVHVMMDLMPKRAFTFEGSLVPESRLPNPFK